MKTASAPRCCSYCKLLPRGKKLKRCSRCHRAWYHDADCQRKHFPSHKEECRKWSTGNPSSKSDSVPTAPTAKVLDVEYRDGRGKCLVVSASSSEGIRKGERIWDCDKKQDHWDPLVPPVLFENNRESRCALCFNALPEKPELVYFFSSTPKSPMYRLLFCSGDCMHAASRMGLEREERDVYSFLQHGGVHRPPRILSAGILLYRIMIREQQGLHHDNSISDQVRALQSKLRRETSERGARIDIDVNKNESSSSPRKCHTKAVILIAICMLQYSESSSSSSLSPEFLPSMEYLEEMVHRIHVNGFTIARDEEFNKSGANMFGVGLYGVPSYMNHSCRPNAYQSFLFRPASPPVLHVTAFRDIAPKQEVCISYTDHTPPSHIRMAQLEGSYFFECNCEACDTNSNLQDDSKTMAIRCLVCPKSLSSHSSVIRTDRGMSPSRRTYKCTECNNSNFESTLQKLGAFEKERSDSLAFTGDNPRKLIKTYQNLKKICFNDSWYVQEAGDSLLEYYADTLAKQSHDPTEQSKTAWEALQIAEELTRTSAPPNHGADDFLSFWKYQKLRYKAAMLRTYVDAHPRESIQDLQEILQSLQSSLPKSFLPDDHPAIMHVKASLAEAMML